MWFTKNAHWPCELTLVTLLPLCVSPPQPDHSAPVTALLALPTGYNYSVFCCSPLLSLSSFLCLSQPGWVLTPTSRRRAAGPLLCVHNMLNATHCTAALNRSGGGDGKGEREGTEGGVTGCQGLWARGEVGVEERRYERTCCPAGHLPASAHLSPKSVPYIIYCLFLTHS